MNEQRPKPRSNSSELMRYAGLGAQIFVTIGIAVFAGLKADKWLHIPLPLLVWLLPLVAVSLLIYKLVKETSKPK
ncbi:AtpZ/AtpI family protein [Flaviaesturariibacter aridisoli]|uniref:AtpZ/AtpI family protein n=1 Tax=Flaviaesturariibacter aridisoli TaxID=2545761 RepID=A0A4R4E4M7_9BACT|nr:AtpZ/AtpI family protein [Flaviaesturariibacter aridisoli]RYY65091.1 MAG: AtpZ/AtpI family protein [Chitinophagaceae bacterium]TCZ74546.1 AtpZ/AtpI family protein [Flaviaesturariibacter aridisoli]